MQYLPPLSLIVTGVLMVVSCTINPNLRDDFEKASSAQASSCAQLALAAVEQGKRDAARTTMLGQMKQAVEENTKATNAQSQKFEEWANELRAQRNAVCLPMSAEPTPPPNPFGTEYLRQRLRERQRD